MRSIGGLIYSVRTRIRKRQSAAALQNVAANTNEHYTLAFWSAAVLRRFSIWAIGGVFFFSIGVALAVSFLSLPDDLQKSPTGTLTLLDCRGREIAELASPQARTQFPVALEQMGPWLPRITVALEDRRFYEHRGIDWRATVGACARNLRSRQIVSGASTITQQLVKLASSRDRRSWSGKLYEAIVAWKLERRWSKQRILSEYLNRSSYGNRRLGPEAAARAYFGKPARDLTLSEAIFLAGLPQAPTRFNPWRHAEEANRSL
jgi:penicillin-binding protein 1C